jgi:hypothetical protein
MGTPKYGNKLPCLLDRAHVSTAAAGGMLMTVYRNAALVYLKNKN